MKKLITERSHAEKQHTSPCSDCPWRRDSLNGWLGGFTPESWIATAHGDMQIQCHTLDKQCAGAAIYRRNVCKVPIDPGCLSLPKDTETVFATPMQFLEHYKKPLRKPRKK